MADRKPGDPLAEATPQDAIEDRGAQDHEQADEVFVCNSVYGIWPVRAFASLNWSAGPLTRKLQRIARALLDA